MSNWKSCSEGSHSWEHIYEWCGRYQCKACGVLGYRGLVLGTAVAKSKAMAIIPYKCPSCHGPTTKFRKKRAGEFRVRDGAQLCPSCVQEPRPSV
jgi:hypothetical protein